MELVQNESGWVELVSPNGADDYVSILRCDEDGLLRGVHYLVEIPGSPGAFTLEGLKKLHERLGEYIETQS